MIIPSTSRALACLLVSSLIALPSRAARAQSPTSRIDSLTQMLDSPDLDQRTRGVSGLRAFSPAVVPAATRTKLYNLLDAIGRTVERTSGDHDDLPVGEFQMQLAKLIVSFRDPASIHALALGGVEVSGAIEDFLASQGSAAVSALDESLAIDPDRRSSVLSTFARMITQYSSSLTPDLAVRLRGDILASAGDDTVAFVFAADEGALVEAIPMLQDLQAAGKLPEVLPGILAHLTAVRAAMALPALLADAQAAHDAVCRNAANAKHGACQSTDSHLKNAQKALAAGRTQQAKDALTQFIDRVNEAVRDGAFTPGESRMLVGAATYLMTRL